MTRGRGQGNYKVRYIPQKNTEGREMKKREFHSYSQAMIFVCKVGGLIECLVVNAEMVWIVTYREK